MGGQAVGADQARLGHCWGPLKEEVWVRQS